MAPLLWRLDTVVFELGSIGAILFCLCLALLYVGSLYIRALSKAGRDHPDVIKGRFLRVLIVCLVSVPLFWFCSTTSHSVKARDIFTLLGLRFRGSLYATIFPLLLTMILFLGPLTLHYLDGVFQLYTDVKYWKSSFQNLIWLRNHVVIFTEISTEARWKMLMCNCLTGCWAFGILPGVGKSTILILEQGPFTEEFVFRACMLPVLVPSLGENWSLILCPLFFGVAHWHHFLEKLRQGTAFNRALLSSGFQFGYTTVFGIYSAFLFLRTDDVIESSKRWGAATRKLRPLILSLILLVLVNGPRISHQLAARRLVLRGHLVAPFVVHAFCNHMGFPNFSEILGHPSPTRYYVGASFVGGLILWSLLLFPLTEPGMYSNDLYYS